MFDKLKILFIEDSENDAVLMTHYLKSIFKEVLFTRIETKEEIELALKNEDWDIIIIDNALPQLTAFEAINQIKKMNVDKPMICTSGTELLDIKERC
ncbi:MAG: response regulator, partial [Asgard group archaeon]|nr:response regulator [Asgard group archaeon]